MTKNLKIALGCGGAGCLGLILLVIVGAVLIVTGVVRAPGLYDPDRNSSSNTNYNYNSNRNSNSNSNTNTNANDNSNSNSSSDSSSSMSDDDKHKLFQTAGITQDTDLIMRVIRKIGFGSGTGSDYTEFVKGHVPWALKNAAFIQSVNTPEKGRAYVDEHIND